MEINISYRKRISKKKNKFHAVQEDQTMKNIFKPLTSTRNIGRTRRHYPTCTLDIKKADSAFNCSLAVDDCNCNIKEYNSYYVSNYFMIIKYKDILVF